MKKWLVVILLVALVSLQIRLWVGEGSIAHVISLKREIEKQKTQNTLLKARNDELAAEVQALKSGHGAIEARARQDMGYIKKGETYFMVIEKDKKENSSGKQ